MSTPEVRPSPQKEGLVGKVYCKDGLRYIYGYRSICLATNEEDNDKAIAARLSPSTVLVRVDSSSYAPQTIEIYCEEIIFISGAVYRWSSKSLRIRCRKVSLISHGEVPAPVQFILSGDNGDDAPAQHNPSPKDEEIELKRAQAPGLTVREIIEGFGEATTLFCVAQYAADKPAVAAQLGKNGAKGVPGNRGHDAGNFQLLADVVDSTIVDKQEVFIITCNGGNGGKGQDGEGGTDGGGGLDLRTDFITEYFPRDDPWSVYENLLRTFLGAEGGKGGNGGPGGRGGSSGSITIAPKALKDACKLSALKGASGMPGEDGKSGATGSYSASRVHQNRISFWEKYAGRIAETDTENRALAKTIHEWGQNGKVPDVKQASKVDHLVDEALWALYADHPQEVPHDGTIREDDVTKKELHSAYLDESSFLQRIMDRLRFEHFIYFSCQPYSDPTSGLLTSGADEVTKTKESMAWIISVFEDVKADHKSPLIRSIYQSYAALAQLYISTPTIDVFSHSVSFVPYTSSSNAFEKTLQNFKTVEDYYIESAVMLAGQAQQRDVLQSKIKAARDLISSSNKAIGSYRDKANMLAERYKTAAANVREYCKLLEVSVGDMRDDIQTTVECKLESILDSLASAMMFTDIKNPIAIAGAVLSVGLGTVKSIEESFYQVGGVDKSMLFARMDVMTKASKDLKVEIATTVTANSQQFEDGKEALAQIITDRAKFDAMVDQYFADMVTPQVVKRRFNDLIKAIDRKNKILIDYNGVVMAVAKAQLDINDNKTLIEQLSSSKASLTDEELQVIGLCMSRAYEDMGRFAVQELYARVRAFNCVSMTHSRAFDFLAPLDSFASITSKALQNANMAVLQEEFHKLQADWVETGASDKTVSMVMTETDHPFSFVQFRDSRSITFDIDWEMFRPILGDDDAWDIRLRELSVYVVTPPPPNATAGVSTNAPGATAEEHSEVQLHISSSGLFRYRDKSLKTHTFELPPTKVPFSHPIITDIGSPKERFTPISKPVKGEWLQLDFLDGVHDPVPLQSPLGIWTIQVISEADLSQTKQIRFDFHITYRI